MIYCDYCTETIRLNETSFESEECKQKCRFCVKCYEDLRLKNEEKANFTKHLIQIYCFVVHVVERKLYVVIQNPGKDYDDDR